MFQRVMFGTLREAYRSLPDLSPVEVACAAPLLVLTVLLGLFPQPVIAIIEPSLQRIVALATDPALAVLR
jgi:NADH-quinone oxidoreductase subunit M